MHFVMAERGSVFSTQDRAVRLFNELRELEAAHPGDEDLTIDFDGVRHLGDSLAGAFIGRVFVERREAGRPEPVLVGMEEEVGRAVERALESEMPAESPALAIG